VKARPLNPKTKEMKQYIIPILFTLTVMLFAFTPAGSDYNSPYWSARPAFTTDTLTDADTMTYSIGSFNVPVAIEVQIAADSLSGTMAGSVQLQQSINGSDWFTVDTETLSGTTVRLKATGDVLGGTLRAYVLSTGTQSTALRMDAIVAESLPAQ